MLARRRQVAPVTPKKSAQRSDFAGCGVLGSGNNPVLLTANWTALPSASYLDIGVDKLPASPFCAQCSPECNRTPKARPLLRPYSHDRRLQIRSGHIGI